MLFELRQYEIKPGRREDWVQLMEEEIIPYQISKGMVVVGSFVGEEDESVYVWIRRFEDEEERVRLYQEVYETDYWQKDIGPRVGDILNREAARITRLVPTPKSVIR